MSITEQLKQFPKQKKREYKCFAQLQILVIKT